MSLFISVIGAAKRSERYRGFYDSLARGAHVPFEVIFVGPNSPIEPMPDNFKYIQTNVKPAQCIEIAARSAVGEYLTVSSDDVSYSAGFLDRMYRYVQRFLKSNILVSCRYSINGVSTDHHLALNMRSPEAPILGQSAIFFRELWNSLGGIDSRFVASNGDLDMQFRFYEQGFQPFIVPDCIINEVIRKLDIKAGTLYRKSGHSDTKIFHSAWIKNGQFSKTRDFKVLPFKDKGLLSVSQGGSTSIGKHGRFTWN